LATVPLAARRAGEVAEAVGDGRDLVAQRACIGLAAVQRLEARELLGARLDRVGQPQQQARALHRRRLAPGVEGAVRGRHGLVHLLDRGLGQRHQQLAGGRVQHLLGVALAAHEGTVDQQLGGQGDVGHAVLLEASGQRCAGSSARVRA
jgi:hypothetical protein